MKRIVSLVLALSMVLSMFSAAFAGTTLPDVEGTEYEAAVSALVELGIVNGYKEDGTYRPSKVVSRAEMAKLLVVAAGLEPAADVSKGETKFSDVPASHWATGYINVASEYGYINGYPDGTFAPDATVSYAEAVTMAIRVLGYKSVVEVKGTWPTNYIAKAQELKVLDDVKYDNYKSGATRGNVALLMWNMLRTRMWDVESENESNGLNYSKQGTMIAKYFEDYLYIDADQEAVVTGIEVDAADREVTVELTLTFVDQYGVAYRDTVDYKLAKDTDFLKLFGRSVTALYNRDTEELVMIIPESTDTIAEDYIADLTKDGYTLVESGDKFLAWGKSGDATYSMNVIERRKVAEFTTVFDTTDTVIVNADPKDPKNDKVRVEVVSTTSDARVSTKSIADDAIVLIDGKWATPSDLEVGDVLTTLTTDALYVVSRNVVEGDFESVTTSKVNGEDEVYFVKVDGEKYENVVNFVVEVDEDGKKVATTALNTIQADDESKFYGEEATLFLNFLGEVVRIEFPEVDENETEGEFYALTYTRTDSGEVFAYWTTGGKNSYPAIELNGEDYEVKTVGVSGDALASLVPGTVVFARFDSEGKVKELKAVPTVGSGEWDKYTFVNVTSGDVVGNDILDDDNYISGDHKVNSKTTVYTITPVKDEDDENIIEYYEVEITKGTEALSGVERVTVAYETEDSFKKAAYVFVYEEAKNTEKTFGLIEGRDYTNGKYFLTIDGTTFESEVAVTSGEVGKLALFVENDGKVELKATYAASALISGDMIVSGDKSDDRVAITASGKDYDFDREFEVKKYEDYRIFEVNVVENDDATAYEISDYTEIAYADITVNEDDIIYEDATNEIFFIVIGYNK